MKDVSFGQYYPAKSFVHSMDARVKLLLIIAYIVFVFLIKNFIGFVPIVLFLSLAIIFAKIPLRSVLRSIKGVLFLVIFAAVLNTFMYSGADAEVLSFGGVPVPAHINRGSNGILNALGFLPPFLPFSALEVARDMPLPEKGIPPLFQLHSSDAHYLENILEREVFLELDEPTPEAFFKSINNYRLS